jgi:ring-1,2-phenylacetyl-CoA epoxidase subunit PaaC
MSATLQAPSVAASISPGRDPATPYVLRLADTCLILGQRIAEWCGHAPLLEEDIALTNMSLDLIGQARALLTHAGRISGLGHDEDQLAFLREERDYLNPTLVELPRGDFAFTVLRNAMVAIYLSQVWQGLTHSSDAELAAIAGKAVKEARYHVQHACDWVVRLGDGTAESRQRMEAALATLWRYTPELFEDDAVDAHASATRLGPRSSELHAAWRQEMTALLSAATLAVPGDSKFRSTGRQGVHSEHMGYILADMQYLQRAYPGGSW